MCPQVILYVWVVSSMWWLMIVYDCSDTWLLFRDSGIGFYCGGFCYRQLERQQHDIFMKRQHDFMAKAVEQGLVRKAAALSGWSHFCAQCLGADVQQLQKHTEFPGESEGQSSCSQLCLFVKANWDDRIVLSAPRNCLPGVSMLTWSPTSEKLRCCSKCKSARGLNTCNIMQLWIIRSVDPGSGYVWLIAVMIFWERWWCDIHKRNYT